MRDAPASPNDAFPNDASPDARLYRYDAADRQFVRDRVAQFRDQVARRLSGALSEDEFKPLRLMNGLYLQLHAYMLRVAIPYGVLSSAQMRQLAHIARRWDRGYGHFTTRQNIQFNWPALGDTPDILAALADVDMHAIQTSGNCIRNVTSDEFAGAAADEIVDPRVYCEILRQWSTLHPEFSFLPRKFKFAVTGSPTDRVAARFHDIGVRTRRDTDGAVVFEVFAGGGLGRTPVIGIPMRDALPEPDFLRYMEAILRVYNAHGRRDNIYKARIKILVQEMGADAFRAAVEAEFDAMPRDKYRLDADTVAQIRAHFAPPPLASLAPDTPVLDAQRRAHPAFGHWLAANTHPHAAPGYLCAVISLKPVGGIPGDATAAQMDAVADLADRYAFGEIRVTHTQNLVLPHVRQDEAHALWTALGRLDLATANRGLVSDIIACPGLDYCALANARAIPVAQRIAERFADMDRQRDIGVLTTNISGCINACGHHHVGHIGILGVDRKGEEYYQVTLGGDAGEDAAIGQIVGPSFSEHEVVGAVAKIVDVYVARRDPGEAFLATYRRLGAAPFKEALYGAA
jgi:sulfite reductase (NADPH) hemoprotein beta-component